MNKRKFVFYSFLSSMSLMLLFSCNGIKSEKINLKGTDALEIGETSEIEAEVLPKETSDKKINWSSSDESVAFVNSEGKVTGIKPGKATITATSNSSSRVKQSLEINVGNYISTHVESVTIKNSPATINDGEYIVLNADVAPSNAENKKLKWTSSNPKIVSVLDGGIIKGELPSEEEVTITATSVDGGKTSTIKVKCFATDKKKLVSFREPNCIANYNRKVNESVKTIDEKTINRDNSASYINGSFYKDTSGKLDTYKVGNKNRFDIKCIASWGAEGWDDHVENNPWQKCVVKQNGAEITTGFELNDKKNEITFDNIGSYEISVSPDDAHYENTKSEFTKTFNVEVIDGYNVYNFADLTTIDNWSEDHAKKILTETHSIFTSKEFVDCWADFKKENEVPVYNFKNVILQNDITIKNEYLPKYIKWTDKETDDYIAGKKEAATQQRFNDYVEIKTNIHQDDWKGLPVEAQRAKCRYILNGSQKDGTAIFNRIGKEPFALEGNYFTIDASNIKPVAMFEQTTLDYYQKNATNVACLIDFGGFGDYHHKYHICSKQESIQELTYDEFRPFTPSQNLCDNPQEIKNVQIHGNSTRDVTHDEGMGGVNLTTCSVNCKFTNLLCHECSNAFYGQGRNEKSIIEIERCKVFDMFSSFIRSYAQKKIVAKDSFFKDSGGVGVTLIEPVTKTDHPDTTMNINNTYMEAFVSGDEIFNKNNMGHYIIKVLAAIGLGAWEQYKNLNFNGNPCDHRSIVKVEDEVPKINFLIFHNYSPFLQNIEEGKTVVKVNDKTDIVKLRENTDVDIYNNMDPLAILSMPVQSSAGGHGAIPIRKIAEANDLELYDKNIPTEVSAYQTYMLSYYKEHEAEINKSCKSYAENAAKLFSGDYLTTYFKVGGLLGYHMSAFVLGYK